MMWLWQWFYMQPLNLQMYRRGWGQTIMSLCASDRCAAETQGKGIACQCTRKCQCVYTCKYTCKCQRVSVLQTCSSDVRELIAAVDRKSTGYISYDDFEAVMARSLLQHTRSVEAAVDLSATIRLQPDFSALPFHEVPVILINTLELLCFFPHTAVLLHIRHHIAC